MTKTTKASARPVATAVAPGSTSGSASSFISGSSTLPALIDIAGVEVQLGTVVAAAHAASGLSAADWDALDPAKRDELLNAQIETMRAAAAGAAEAKRVEDERLEQERLDAEAQAEAARKRTEGEPLFPRQITVRNNGPIALVEPLSGSHTQAGGTSVVTLHDEEHAHRVLENFAALLDQNFLKREVLSIEGLPE